MLSCSIFRFPRLGSALALGGLLTCAQAAELGDVAVRSYIGQPLVADIELTSVADGATPVQVTLASPDVYRGASIGMDPVLATVHMSVMRRDGRQYLHITSVKPLAAEHLHLFLELADGSRRDVRGATLWLAADPQPAVVTMPVAVAPPMPAPVAATAPEPVALAAPVRVRTPGLHASERAPAAAPTPASIPAATAIPLPLALRGVQTSPPAACTQQFSAAQIKSCAALDEKNAALTTQLVALEDKVRLLQNEVGAPPVVAAPIRPLLKPAAAASPKAAIPAKKSEGGVPWGWLAVAVAALCATGGGLYEVARRKAAKGANGREPLATPAAANFIESVKSRLAPSHKEAESVPILEPSLE